MEKARALVNVRDINLICHYYKTMRRLKAEPGDIRSREPAGEMASWKSELRLVTNGCIPSHGPWWINDMGVPIRYMAQDIR